MKSHAILGDAACWRAGCSAVDACRAVWWGTPPGCIPPGIFASGGARYARTLPGCASVPSVTERRRFQRLLSRPGAALLVDHICETRSFNLCLEFVLKDKISRFFLHEFETRICFMNSRHEWALPRSAFLSGKLFS